MGHLAENDESGTPSPLSAPSPPSAPLSPDPPSSLAPIITLAPPPTLAAVTLLLFAPNFVPLLRLALAAPRPGTISYYC